MLWEMNSYLTENLAIVKLLLRTFFSRESRWGKEHSLAVSYDQVGLKIPSPSILLGKDRRRQGRERKKEGEL